MVFQITILQLLMEHLKIVFKMQLQLLRRMKYYQNVLSLGLSHIGCKD